MSLPDTVETSGACLGGLFLANEISCAASKDLTTESTVLSSGFPFSISSVVHKSYLFRLGKGYENHPS